MADKMPGRFGDGGRLPPEFLRPALAEIFHAQPKQAASDIHIDVLGYGHQGHIAPRSAGSRASRRNASLHLGQVAL
jgi:hypothetical protein